MRKSPPPDPPTKDTTLVPTDSIPQVYLDTTFYLGAIRDLSRSNKGTLEFELDTTIGRWALLYGAGDRFFKELQYYQELLTRNELAQGVTDPLTGYSLNYLRYLPGPGDGFVNFVIDPGILPMSLDQEDFLLSGPGESLVRIPLDSAFRVPDYESPPGNYHLLIGPGDSTYNQIPGAVALDGNFRVKFSISFANRSQSFGQNVYIKILVFKRGKPLYADKPKVLFSPVKPD